MTLSLTTAVPAHADPVSGVRYTYWGPPECTWGGVELSGEWTLKLGSHVESNNWTGSRCGYYVMWQPYGTLFLKQDLLKWGGSSWFACNSGPWTYNPSGGWGWDQYWNPGGQPCGGGWYAGLAYAYQWDGAWYGDVVVTNQNKYYF